MVNFLDETERFIDQASPFLKREIIFIGDAAQRYSCTWEEFAKMANFEYDITVMGTGHDSGLTTIPRDLVIVFQGGSTMIREEHARVERWRLILAFNPNPAFPPSKIKKLFNPDLDGLSVMQLHCL